jgi:hypothetical protein
MAFNFPASPTVGQTYTPAGGGPTYSWNGVSWSVVNQNGGFAQQTFTATLGQTIFTPTNPYTPGLIDVFQNGVKLVLGSDYTAVDGTTVVLSAGAALGDTIQTIAYAAVTGANTYTRAEIDALLNPANTIIKASRTGANMAMPAASITGLIWNTLDKGPAGCMDANGIITPTVAGWYFVKANAGYTATTTTAIIIKLYRNGGHVADTTLQSTNFPDPNVIGCSAVLYFNGTTDTVQAIGQINATSNMALIGNAALSYLHMFRIAGAP